MGQSVDSQHTCSDLQQQLGRHRGRLRRPSRTHHRYRIYLASQRVPASPHPRAHMAADISRARAAQSGRLSALRGLRTSGGGGAPGGGGRAAAAPLGGGGPAPIACVLPLSSSEQAVQRLVASPSGRSAAVIFEDSTAQVHPLPGCAALARATSLMMPSSVPCFVLRASLPHSLAPASAAAVQHQTQSQSAHWRWARSPMPAASASRRPAEIW
jgi:hypothetical protein